MYISIQNTLYGQENSIRNVLIHLILEEDITEDFIKNKINKLKIYSEIDVKDIMGRVIYKEGESIRFTIVEDIDDLLGENIIPIKLNFEHESIIPTFDNKIGANVNSQLSLKVTNSNNTSENNLIEKSVKDKILSQTNINSLRNDAIYYYEQFEKIENYLNGLGIEKNNDILIRIKKAVSE
jgi:hypothetical protein